MTERVISRNHALQLPTDIWSRIFAFLKPNCEYLEYHDGDGEVERVAAQQAQLHQLRLVCTNFNQIIEQHPQLLDQLLPSDLSSEGLPSLVCWLKRHNGSVRIFMPFCSTQCQAVLLDALLCPSSQLLKVYLMESTMLHVHMLSAFTTITKCSLFNPISEPMDLKPLHTLCSLQELFLEYGEYTAVPLASHLTWLDIHQSTVSCVQLFGGTAGLRDLLVKNSSLVSFCREGLSGCSGLTCLDALNS